MTCDEVRSRLSWVLDGEAPEVEAHLAQCPGCREEFERMRKADRLLEQAAECYAQPAEPPSRRLQVLKWTGAAAAALFLGFIGLWIWKNQQSPDAQEVLVFGAEKWVAGAEGVLRVVVRDGERQIPVTGARVHASLGKVSVRAVSGEDGSAEIRLPVPELQRGHIEISVDSSAGSDRVERDIVIERPARMLLSTDKPLYQPAQTIHLRALALNSFTQKPLEEEVTFVIEDPNGNRVFKKALRTSAFGIASVDFDLADEVVLGTWRIRVSMGSVESERTVEVKRYVLPKFRVTLTPDRTFYEPGSAFRADLDVQYLFGKPVAQGDVRVELSSWVGGKFEAFAQLKTKTDSAGKAVVETQLADRYFGTELQRGDATLRIEAEVSDGAQHTERKAVLSTVTRQAIRMQAFAEGGEYVVGIAQDMFVVTSYPDGRPAPCKVTLDDRAGEFETDETGVLRLPIRKDRVSIGARDAKGQSCQLPFQLSSLQASQDFLLRPDRVSYRAGEAMKLDVLAAKDGVIYVDLVKAGQTLLTRSVEVRKGLGSLVFDLPAELFGTLRVSAYRIQPDGRIERDSRIVIVDLPGDLQIRPRLRKPEFRPGEEISVDFEVLDSKGKPVQAAIGLAVVDEAVFALHEARPGLEKAYFQIEEDLLKPRGQLKALESLALPALAPVRLAATAAPPVAPLNHLRFDFKRRKFQMELSRFNENALAGLFWMAGLALLAILVKAMVSGGRVGCYLSLMLLAGLAVYIAIPGMLQSQRASNYRPESMAMLTPPTPATPGKSDPGGAASRIRQYFPETLYWNPQLITDEHGKASIAFPGADSITTWRLAMSAVTRGGQLGSGEGGIRVFQPFFIDLDLPVSLTQGDEVWLPVAIYNYLKEPQTVTLRFESEDGLEVLGGREKKLDVRAGDVSLVRFHVKAARFGRFALTVHAVGSKFSDAVRRTLEVLPDGLEKPLTSSNRVVGRSRTTVTIPPGAIPGASRLWVRVFPSTFSEVVKGLEGLVQMPYG